MFPFPEQQDEQPDEKQVAREHEERRQELEVAAAVPVAIREPELGHDERGAEEERRPDPTPPGDERHRRHEPDEKLR